MKCLSIHEPWASLIVSGRRRLEIRKWPTQYRGPLLIHAGLKIERDECKRLGVAPHAVGAIIGVATLKDVFLVSQKDWKKLQPLHLERRSRPYGDKTYAWVFENPEPFGKPIPLRGRLSLFEVPENILPKQYTILKNGVCVKSFVPGRYAGWAPGKIFGRLDCNSGTRMKKENRVFFHSWEDAIAAGFRPCKVCKPRHLTAKH